MGQATFSNNSTFSIAESGSVTCNGGNPSISKSGHIIITRLDGSGSPGTTLFVDGVAITFSSGWGGLPTGLTYPIYCTSFSANFGTGFVTVYFTRFANSP